MVRGGRRGMSPLIATVLLMAFAVALGGMIMNWSIDSSSSGDCAMLAEQITVNRFCTQAGAIVLSAQGGKDSPPLLGIELGIISGSIENNVKVKNSDMESGGQLYLEIPVPVSEGAIVELIGVIGSPSAPTVCAEDPIERVAPILPC